MRFNFLEYLNRHREWSGRTFGPATAENDRTPGVLDHIRKELKEIEANPRDCEEWVDLIILAIDGASRNGCSPWHIIRTLRDKQRKNIARKWPDWREVSPDKAIEHVRNGE